MPDSGSVPTDRRHWAAFRHRNPCLRSRASQPALASRRRSSTRSRIEQPAVRSRVAQPYDRLSGHIAGRQTNRTEVRRYGIEKRSLGLLVFAIASLLTVPKPATGAPANLLGMALPQAQQTDFFTFFHLNET